jgi:hypothetical protein
MKKHLFFCEHCGTPVPIRAKTCPHCGRYFNAVKCPRCSFVGSPGLFEDGCPQCGYLSDNKDTGSSRADNRFQDITDHFVKEHSEVVEETEKPEKPGRDFPSWLYWVIGLGLLGLIIVFIILFNKL